MMLVLLFVETINWAYWLDIFLSFLIELVPAVFTALLTAWFLDRAFQKSKHIGDSLIKSGIEDIKYASGKMTKKDSLKFFGLNGNPKPEEINLCFLTGDNFFLDYYSYLLELVNSGTRVKVLIANPFDSNRVKDYLERYPVEFSRENSMCKLEDRQALGELYYKYYNLNSEEFSKLTYLERTFLMVSKENIERISNRLFAREYGILTEEEKKKVWLERVGKTGDHIMQVLLVTKIVESINKQSTGTQIELYYYKDEYRIPITLAKFNKNDKEEILLWTNMNAPVKETTKSVNVFGKTDDENDATYVSDVLNSFNYLFDKYSR